jgi:hypothetical protein
MQKYIGAVGTLLALSRYVSSVWIRPFVLKPQMKKVPASTQNRCRRFRATLGTPSRTRASAALEDDLARLAIRNQADVGGAVDHEQKHRDGGDAMPISDGASAHRQP